MANINNDNLNKNKKLRKIPTSKKTKISTQNSNLDDGLNSKIHNENLNNKTDNLDYKNNNLNSNTKPNTQNLYIKNQTKDKSKNSIFKKDELKNKRDYDKEPLIIKDYKPTLIFLHYLFFIFIAFVFTIVKNISIINFIYFLSMVYITTLRFNYIDLMFNSKDKKIIFYENTIEIRDCKTDAGTIITKEIFNINKTIDIRRFLTGEISRSIVIICFLVVGLFFLVFDFAKLISFLIFFYLIYFLPKILLQIYIGGFKSIRFFDCLGIYSKTYFINIFIVKEQDYQNIRSYFLTKKGIDIEKVESKIFIF
ncbi:putative membrane protein [Campylobacter blaseri]|uniref:Uncharacterized protein n=1 Tax=Campylobacter blaseri TaxID=2042961 RepID=A0A2P8R1W1_9BACT|nr:hypothetical protein [Campylobacter blaseri]PSM52492.1 hypothetical protein CQ405_01840 [Campylobacter blaseri]PSM54140.1 hypothetical protein CRN67_01840 [Campylobacter blaseri]QKF85788.1 putative membrane protein [Campylobacter blaseri]